MKPEKTGRRVLQVPATATRRAHTRSMPEIRVTFVCARCRQESERVQYPGKWPDYCAACAKEAKREATRERVRRLRAGQRANR